jgi:anti-anti-sigma factor
MLMEISQRELDSGAVVVVPAGRVVVGAETEQIVTLVEELLRHGSRTIIFDLGGVSSLDSTGIGRFIACYKEIVAAGGKMRMAGAAGYLVDVFHITRLDTVFPFYATVEEAAKA